MLAGMDGTPAAGRVDVAAVGALFGDPARVAMLSALADGRALPAGELARAAGVLAPTATVHLRKLVDAGLVQVRQQGRHRYHQLAGPEVAAVLEALARVAPRVPVRSLRQHREAAVLGEARTCYDHLAGRLGVELCEALLAAAVLRAVDERDHELTEHGEEVLARLGIDVAGLRSCRRVQARTCLDWTERRPHLAGAIPAAITAKFLQRGWLTRTTGRGLRAAASYQHDLDELLAQHATPGGRRH